jgi:hypothetical protein
VALFAAASASQDAITPAHKRYDHEQIQRRAGTTKNNYSEEVAQMRTGILLAGAITIFAGMMALGSLSRVWADAHVPVDYAKISPQDLVNRFRCEI